MRVAYLSKLFELTAPIAGYRHSREVMLNNLVHDADTTLLVHV